MQNLTLTKVDYALLPTVAVTAFLIAPLAVVASNIQDFQNLDVTLALLFFLGIALLMACLGFLLSATLLLWRSVRTIASALLRLAFFGSLLSALVFPLAVSAGQVEIQLIPVHQLNLVIVSVLATALTIVSFTRVRGVVFAAAFTVLAGSAVSNFAIVAVGIKPPELAAKALLEASSEGNVFVISFDGLPRNVAKEVISENLELEFLRDFVFFDQLIGSAPATSASIFSELSGIKNLKEVYDTQAAMEKSSVASPPTPLTTNLLDSNGYVVSTYGVYSSTFGNSDRAFAMGSLGDVVPAETMLGRFADVLDYGLARVATSHFSWAGRVFRNVVSLFIDPQKYTDVAAFQSRVASHVGAIWDIDNILSIVDIERYSSELSVGTSKKVAHFLHFTHTHYPVDFDQACQYRGDDSGWYISNQNRDGLKNQVYCAFSQFSGFISHLKSIGAYDNALIILKSDHGEPVSYNDPKQYEGFKIRDHEFWGVGRYLPFLAIKPFGGRRDEMLVDSRHVSMIDLAYTICDQTMSVVVDCNVFGEIDLLDPSAVIPVDDSYFVYLPKGPDSTFEYDTHEAMELSRAGQFEVELINKLTDELVSTRSACNLQVDVTQGRPNSNGLTDGQSWVTWSNGGESFIKISPPTCGQSVLEISLDVAGDVMAEVVGSPNSSPIIERDPGGRAALSIESNRSGPGDLAITVRVVHSDTPTPPVVTSYIYRGTGERSGTSD